MKKWVVLAVVVILVAGAGFALARLVPASGSASRLLPATGSALPTPSAWVSASDTPSALPSGGLSSDAAEALVRAAGTVGTVGKLRGATAGQAVNVMTAQAIEAAGLQPTRWVWGLEFDAMSGPICPPDGSSCFPSKPGSLHVFVDYFTGETLSSSFSSSGG
jgi:hypothetical protein